jgi:uncharacterized protein with PQ loop repeat
LGNAWYCSIQNFWSSRLLSMPMDILWLHIRSLQMCLWVFYGYIYEVYKHACRYSVVTYTKFTEMPVGILWLHIRSLQKCLWIFCGYIYEVYRHACGYSVVTYTDYNFAFGMGMKHVRSVWGKKISFSFEHRVVTGFCT